MPQQVVQHSFQAIAKSLNFVWSESLVGNLTHRVCNIGVHFLQEFVFSCTLYKNNSTVSFRRKSSDVPTLLKAIQHNCHGRLAELGFSNQDSDRNWRCPTHVYSPQDIEDSRLFWTDFLDTGLSQEPADDPRWDEMNSCKGDSKLFWRVFQFVSQILRFRCL